MGFVVWLFSTFIKPVYDVFSSMRGSRPNSRSVDITLTERVESSMAWLWKRRSGRVVWNLSEEDGVRNDDLVVATVLAPNLKLQFATHRGELQVYGAPREFPKGFGSLPSDFWNPGSLGYGSITNDQLSDVAVVLDRHWDAIVGYVNER